MVVRTRTVSLNPNLEKNQIFFFKIRKIGTKKWVLTVRATVWVTVQVWTFFTYECGCGLHSAVRTAHHTIVRVVLKPSGDLKNLDLVMSSILLASL